MKYLLADTIIYDNEDCSLSLKGSESEENQILTCTANHIFNLLIAHHGMVVERETFLQQVWDERGLNGSNNSLNQYISILRKLLDGIVPDTVFIITVPKTGFMLSADISVVPLQHEKIDKQPSVIRQSRRRFSLITCLCALTVVVAIACAALITQKQTPVQSSLYPLTQIDKCPVYTFTPVADVFQKQAIALTRQIQEISKLRCLENSVFYVHLQSTLFYGDTGRLVLSLCSRSRSKTSTCQTHYYYEW